MHIHAMGFLKLFPDGISTCDKVAVYVSTSQDDDPAAALVETVLGRRAREKCRAEDREFPLRVGAVYFSITHSDRLTAVAVATTPIGVDAEQELPKSALADMRWCLSDAEYREAARRTSRLTEIWTAKEAAAKLTGSGLWPHPERFISTALQARPGERHIVTPQRGAPCSSIGLWLGKWHLRVAAWSKLQKFHVLNGDRIPGH